MGGTDDPSNLVKLTVEEHAEAHRILFEQYNRWQDKLAWQGLAELIGKDEIMKQAIGYGRKHTQEHIEKRIAPLRGRVRSKEVKEKISAANKNHILKLAADKIECPHCGKLSDIGNHKRWHGDRCKQNKC